MTDDMSDDTAGEVADRREFGTAPTGVHAERAAALPRPGAQR